MARWNPFSRKPKAEPKPADVPAPEESKSSPDAEVGSPTVTSSPDESEPAVSVPPVTSAPPEDEPTDEAPKKKSLFGFIKSGFTKTRQALNTDIRDLFKNEGRIVDDEFLDELFAHLIKTDMGAGPAAKIRDDIKAKYRARKLHMKDLIETAQGTIREIMEQESADIHFADSGPTVIMVVGVNGSGKTTSIAKLTHRFREQGKSVVLGAGDTFRAAAVQQLTIWSERLGAEIVTGKQGGDPASVAYRAADTAKKNGAEICIVDTAGRLQTQTNLMDELARIRRVTEKVIPEAPHEVLLVLDATAGQNAISQAKGFSEAAGCTGIVLAKLDGTAKGGVAIPIRQEFGLPVKFIGLGETPDAFAVFDVEQYVTALFEDVDG